ncbi:MAG: hypothetical protein PHN31_06205 [Candidatus Gracilibacteria bacterium]|nr:hypothetical protein [Candidatus Gracilibacteria bacterium]
MISKKLNKHFETHNVPLLEQKIEDILFMIDPKYVEAFSIFRNNLLATIGDDEIDYENIEE